MHGRRVVDQEEADGRFATPEAKAANHKGRCYFADMHRVDLKDDDQWMAKQVYLNVGNFLLGVAAMGWMRYQSKGLTPRSSTKSLA